jgi:hypothetical protein
LARLEALIRLNPDIFVREYLGENVYLGVTAGESGAVGFGYSLGERIRMGYRCAELQRGTHGATIV